MDERETTLFHAPGLLITSERVVAEGRTWRLSDVERVEIHYRAPRIFPWLLGLIVSLVLGLPVLLAAMAEQGSQGQGPYGAALVVAGMLLFGAIVALPCVGDAYWLVLRSGQRRDRVLRSRDARLISRLTLVIEAAAEAARRKH